MAMRILDTFVRGSPVVALVAVVLGWATVVCGQGGPPSLEASSVLDAQTTQRMDTLPVSGFNQNVAAVSDSYVGPITFGTGQQGSATTSVSASASEGIIKLATDLQCSALPNANLSVDATVDGKFADTINVTRGQGNIVASYLPDPFGGGTPILGDGFSWKGLALLNVNINVIGTGPVRRYTLSARFSNGNLGINTQETGPLVIPVSLHDEVTIDADEMLITSIGVMNGGFAEITADLSHTMHLLFHPVSAGVAFAADSGHSYLPVAGDANADGRVNFTDLLTLAQNYGRTNATWEQGDFTGDGTVGFDDLLALAQHYGTTVDGGGPQAVTADAGAVPEPTLLALSLLTSLNRRRRPSRFSSCRLGGTRLVSW